MFNNIFFLNRALYEIMWKNNVENRAGHRWLYGACTLHAGYLRLKTYTQKNISCSFLFHCNNGCMKVPQCYVMH